MNPSLRKAAILVTALDPAAADQLLEQMGEQQAARVRNAVMDLPDVDPVEQEAVLAEFCGNSSPSTATEGGVELALSEAPSFPQAAAGESAPRFEFLHHTSSAELARRLNREHPQLIAVVVANLSAEKSADLLRCFPEPVREEVLDRLAGLDHTDTETLAELHRALQLMFASTRPAPRRSGPLNDHVQSILGYLRHNEQRDFPRTKRDSFTRAVKSHRSAPPPIVGPDKPEIVFDQLLSLHAADFFAVFDEADPRVVMLALAGAPRRLFERYLAQFSTERALEFERHIEQLRPLRLRDVEAAQRALAIVASRRQRTAVSAAEKSRRFAAAA